MPDREKVINGLRCIKGDLILCVDCAYSDGNGHGTYSCKAFCANDALALLKEQEAVEPRPPETKLGTLWRCGSCGREIGFKYHFCQWCGKAVKWE